MRYVDVDYSLSGLNLTFRNSTRARERDIDLDIIQDDLVEGHEIINIILNPPVISGLNNPMGATITTNRHSQTVVIIEEDDGKKTFS